MVSCDQEISRLLSEARRRDFDAARAAAEAIAEEVATAKAEQVAAQAAMDAAQAEAGSFVAEGS